MPYFIYILECVNGAYYTGYTTDLKRRYREHQTRLNKCKYTRSFPPKRIAASWQLECDLPSILKIERRIKAMNRSQKEVLIQSSEKNKILDLLVT